MKKAHELKACDLRYFCDPKMFTFKSTAEIEPLDEVIGQKRAVQAIEFGLNMKNPEYNIFVTGIEGTGKSTITTDITRKHAGTLPTPQDWCMVNNFQDPYRPKPLVVPAGKGSILSRQVDRLIHSLKSKLPKAFEDTAYQEKIGLLHDGYQKQEVERFSALEQSAEKKNLALNKTDAGLQTIPLADGKPLTQEAFLKLSKKDREQIEATVQAFQDEIETTLRDINKIRQEQGKAVEALMTETASSVVREQMEFVIETYDDCPEIKTYLEEVRENIVGNANDFLPSREPADKTRAVLFPEAGPSFHQYKVNVLVDRKDTRGAPVIFEPNPTYQNVFGHIEKKPHMGGMTTDFTMVKAGSFLQADGGFLILEIESLLMHPVVWESLKRALRNKQIFIEDMPGGQGIVVSSLRPQSIPTDVKVLLLGGYEPFQALQNFDPKFNKIFKVRADFDYEVERTDKTIQQ